MQYEALRDFEYTPDHGGDVIAVEQGDFCSGDTLPMEKLRRLIGLGYLAEGKPESWPKGVPPSVIDALESAGHVVGDIPSLSDEQLLEVDKIGAKAVPKIRAAFEGG